MINLSSANGGGQCQVGEVRWGYKEDLRDFWQVSVVKVHSILCHWGGRCLSQEVCWEDQEDLRVLWQGSVVHDHPLLRRISEIVDNLWQGFGSGSRSGSVWILIVFWVKSWIQFRIEDKIQKLSRLKMIRGRSKRSGKGSKWRLCGSVSQCRFASPWWGSGSGSSLKGKPGSGSALKWKVGSGSALKWKAGSRYALMWKAGSGSGSALK